MQYHHIFFHSLVVYPKLAFLPDLDSKRNFELWMVTVSEYKKVLQSLFERNYILVKMSDLLTGNLDIPKGKIPLVVSFDDVNYYDYMKGYGLADRMVLDEQGEISNILITDKGEKIVSGEADGVAILENFIKEHPDFSYRGARGILAVTGYEGVLGYRNPKNSEELKQLIGVLKEKGWEFACHSYHHQQGLFKAEVVDEAGCIEDTRQWLREVAPLVGGTDIYIAPFGIDVRKHEKFHEFLKESGFRFFCDVNNIRQFTCENNCFYFPRINIDGFLFQHRNYEFEYYYGLLEEVLDKQRIGNYIRYGMDGASLAMHARVCSKMPTTYKEGGLGERNEAGRRCFDSSGLINNYLMGGLVSFRYEKGLDRTAWQLFHAATVSGSIETLPEKRGLCLYMPERVGVYMGNGKVIEACLEAGEDKSVMETKVEDRSWTHWFYCPGIEML